jgi:membrane protein YqaA with SNARE-associated domain
MLGWAIGRWLGHFAFIKRVFGEFKDEHRDFIRKFGFWAMALGSVTPFPFSVTCWTAGMMGSRWLAVLLAAILFRIPRFVRYCWLIASSRSWFGFG